MCTEGDECRLLVQLGRIMKYHHEMRRLSRRAQFAWLTFVVLAVLGGLAATSFGQTYQYCPGCTINGGQTRESNVWKRANTVYLHRLSGPSGTGISTRGRAVGSDASTCASGLVTVTQAACYAGGAASYGRSTNWGAGNYGFNAHLTYD